MRATNTCGLIAATAALFLFTVPVLAQEDDGGPLTQGDDAKYVSVRNVMFKPGKRERALEIVAEHFVPAGQKAGTPGPMLVIHHQTGKWDVTAVWELAGGMADLEWYRSANNIKWMEALTELSGGDEEAAAILAEYVNSVAHSETNVGHYHAPEAD